MGLYDWQHLTPAEYRNLQEAYKLREEKTDRRVGRICAVFAEINRDKKKRKKPYAEEDFIPREKKEQSPEEMADVFKSWAVALGGEIRE